MGVAMFFFFLGIVLGSLIEWAAHKYLLHNFSHRIFSHSHFSVHHRNCRKNNNYDQDYENFPPKTLDEGLMEISLLLSGIALTSPLAFISFYLWLGLLFHACLYYFLHRKSHMDVDWGKKWMPWHYEHHMGKKQNSNWGVTNPVFDYVFGTRSKSEKSSDKL